jgi:pyridoxine 5-phosphate synthase
MRFYVNIDHVATVREARKTDEPDPVRAAVLAELGGADGITVHLREDRRHVNDRDVRLLMQTVRTGVNLELATDPQIVELACELRPMQVTLVPERREEVTTEGGLDLSSDERRKRVGLTLQQLVAAGIRTSLFIGPDVAAVEASADLGVAAVELHTGEYAHHWRAEKGQHELDRLERAVERAHELGLAVHAGHGLTYENVDPVARVSGIEELNIGHWLVSRGALLGLGDAVREMLAAMEAGRSGSLR